MSKTERLVRNFWAQVSNADLYDEDLSGLIVALVKDEEELFADALETLGYSVELKGN
jgi:spermidine/putrescine-binding protein